MWSYEATRPKIQQCPAINILLENGRTPNDKIRIRCEQGILSLIVHRKQKRGYLTRSRASDNSGLGVAHLEVFVAILLVKAMAMPNYRVANPPCPLL